MAEITTETKVGDTVDVGDESGTVKSITNGVAEIEVKYQATRTVYVAVPSKPEEAKVNWPPPDTPVRASIDVSTGNPLPERAGGI